MKQYFYGIYGIHFIWNGDTADSLVRYKGKTVNYYDVETTMWERYCEEFGLTDVKDDVHWQQWVKKNARQVKEVIARCNPV